MRDHIPAKVREQLDNTRFTDVRWMVETGSTNSDVLTLARDGAPEGVVVVADQQLAGRGRRGRSWVAPPGSSLLTSVLLRPPGALAGATTMAVGVAMAEAVEAHTGVSPGLKWPNDLVVSKGGMQSLPPLDPPTAVVPPRRPSSPVARPAKPDQATLGGTAGAVPPKPPSRDVELSDVTEGKLAGILAETDWPAGATIAGGWREPAAHERVTVVAGIGVNVNWPARDASGSDAIPADVLDTAVALNWLAGHDVDRGELLGAFLVRLEEHYGAMVRERTTVGVLATWRERSATLGRWVRVDLGAEDVEGKAVGITDEGHLLVDTLEGERRQFAVGDIVHLRAR